MGFFCLMDYQRPVTPADMWADPWNTPIAQPAPSNYNKGLQFQPAPLPLHGPKGTGMPDGTYGTNNTRTAPSPTTPTANYGAKGFGSSYYNPTPPQFTTSPNTIKFPAIDYSKTAAQTGMPESILPRNYSSGQSTTLSPTPKAPPTPGLGRQVLNGGAVGLGIVNAVSIGYNGVVDYNNGIEAGESRFRSGTNAISSMAGSHAMGLAGAQAFGSAGLAIGSAVPGIGTAIGGTVGGFIGYGLGSIAGSASGGWLSDRVLDLFGGPHPSSIRDPNSSWKAPNGHKGNKYNNPNNPGNHSPQNGPQPAPSGSGAPPPSGPGAVPKKPGGDKSPDPFATPPNPLLPWLPDFKWPRMPWDPKAPEKPNDPKNPDNPGNPGKPDPTEPIKTPDLPPLIEGEWAYNAIGNDYSYPQRISGTSATIFKLGVLEKSTIDPNVSFYVWQYKEPDWTGWIQFLSGYSDRSDGAAISGLTFLPGGNQPDPGLAPRPDPSNGVPGVPAANRDNANTNPIGQPPNTSPTQNTTSPGSIPPFMGGNLVSFVPGLYLNPNYTPPSNEGPQKRNDSPATKPGTAPERIPSTRGEPTLNPAPSTSPATNQPVLNTPQPWTNPFFAPIPGGGGSTVISPETNPGKLNTGETNTGKLNTGDQSGNTKWNPETRKYEPAFPGVINPSEIKTPAVAKEPSQTVGSNQKTSFQLPSQTIPLIPAIPAAAKIPKGAIPEPITTPDKVTPSSVCNYKPQKPEIVKVLKFVACDKDLEEISISVEAESAAAWKMSLDNQARIQKMMCEISASTLAIPESWAVRIGTDRPQLVIVYAEIFNSGKLGDSRWSLTIPHYRGSEKARLSLPKYTRGNWHGTLRLNDGSQVVVNASSSQECKRVLNKMKILIPVAYRLDSNGKAYQPRVIDDPNLDLKKCDVIPTIAKYYATGQKHLTPTWTKDLRP